GQQAGHEQRRQQHGTGSEQRLVDPCLLGLQAGPNKNGADDLIVLLDRPEQVEMSVSGKGVPLLLNRRRRWSRPGATTGHLPMGVVQTGQHYLGLSAQAGENFSARGGVVEAQRGSALRAQDAGLRGDLFDQNAPVGMEFDADKGKASYEHSHAAARQQYD